MKLATVQVDSTICAAVVEGGSTAYPVEGSRDVGDLIGLLPEEIDGRRALRGIPLEECQLLAPIRTLNRNVFCTGWNYRAHFEEGRPRRAPDREPPAVPAFFTKATTTVIGPYDAVPSHGSLTEKLDWEVELAVVIGIKGRDITEGDAPEHIFGYMVANDISARDLQRDHGGQWFKGKSLDGTCPLGPWLVTSDEVADPQNLDIRCDVNGSQVQHASTRQMVFSVARLVSELSQGLTLLPGDVLLTGTPEGVGNSRTPPMYLTPGDILRSEISGIGVLQNEVKESA